MTTSAPGVREPALGTQTPALSYLPVEVLGILPPGWNLSSEGDPWDARRRVWRQRVRDPAGVDWQLVVSAADAQRLGRIPALERATDLLYRNALA